MEFQYEPDREEGYIPDLGSSAKVPGLPEASRRRLQELLTKMLFVSYPSGQSSRIEYERLAARNLEMDASRLESDYRFDLADARWHYKLNIVKQLIKRCALVAKVLALYQMYSAGRHHARALAAEVLRSKELICIFPDDHPLVAVLAKLAVLIGKYGSIDPEQALRVIDCTPNLSSKELFKAVKIVFAETKAGAASESDFLWTCGTTVPFVDIHDANGVELALREAVRDAKRASESCRKLRALCKDVRHSIKVQFKIQLADAQRKNDRGAMRRIKQKQQDFQASVFAQFVELRLRQADLQAVRVPLAEALAGARRVINLRSKLSVADKAGVSTLTSVINCIAAHRLLLEIKHQEELNATTLGEFNNTSVSLKGYIDKALAQAL